MALQHLLENEVAWGYVTWNNSMLDTSEGTDWQLAIDKNPKENLRINLKEQIYFSFMIRDGAKWI